MLICIGYYNGDVDQAERLDAWLKEIGPFPGHRLLVARDVDCHQQLFRDAGFDRVDEIVISDDVWKEWPTSANNVFRKIAKHIEYVDKAPYWLWIEPDVVPLRREAFDLLQAEYERSGKPFSGDRVAVTTVPAHMSGVAIYPREMTRHAGEALICYNLAWDMAAREQILPVMHVSRHVLHAWKHPEFQNLEEFQKEIYEFKPECVLFHASKDGSLINILREERKKNLPVPVLAEPSEAARKPALVELQALGVKDGEARESNRLPALEETSEDSRGGQNICDILIKSYPKDYELLTYCLRAIEKHARGFRQVIVVHPEDEIAPFNPVACGSMNLNLKMIPVREAGDGYLFQQTVKAMAHRYTDAEYILHIDSDTLLTEFVIPDSFIYYGLPIWFITPYETMEQQPPWQGATEAFMGSPVRYEFMRRFPFLIPRFLHEFAEKFCLDRHGVKLADYILSQPNRTFSEFNALGAIAHKHFNDRFYWFDTSTHPEAEWPKLVAYQTWSHAELTDEMRAKFEQIISGAGLERPGEPATEAGEPTHRTPAPNLPDKWAHLARARAVAAANRAAGIKPTPKPKKRRKRRKRKAR